jgi:hypothetical protein
MSDSSETRPQQPPTTFDEWWEKYLRGHDESGYWEMPAAKAAWEAATTAPPGATTMTPDDTTAADALTAEEIEELRRLEREATKAPWWVEKCRQHGRLLIKYRWDDVPTWIAESSERAEAAADFGLMVYTRNLLPKILAAASAARQARPPQQGQPILRKVRLTYIGCQVWSAELLHDDGTSSEWRDYGRTRAEAIGMVLRRATEVVPLEIIEVDPAAAVGVGVPAAGTEVAK